MLNRVFLEGEIESSCWSVKKTGFLVTIKQMRFFGERLFTDYYVIYASGQLAYELEKHTKKYKTISIEGILRTYLERKSEIWKTTIEIVKIFNPKNEIVIDYKEI